MNVGEYACRSWLALGCSVEESCLKNSAIILVGVLFFLSGCADNREFIHEKALKLQLTIPHCYAEQECQDKWEAAKTWVAKNCPMAIKTVTDSTIETVKSPHNSSSLSAVVSKEAFAGGKYRFIIKTWCDNAVGCIPDAYNSALNFNDYLSAVHAK